MAPPLPVPVDTVLASIPPPPLQELSIGPLDIRMYGILIATGVLVAVTWLRRRHEALGGDPDLTDRIAIRAVVAGFLGARLGYVLPRLDRFVDDPLSVLAIWEGGLALYGGLTVGLIALVVMLRRHDVDLPAFADALAPALPAAQAIGRWGNWFNQELFGTPTDLPWALEVDPEHRVAPHQAAETFHPTFLYESLGNLLLVGVILGLQRRGRLRRGSLLAVYAIGYGSLRFALELLRTDTTWRIAGLSRNALVSLAFVTLATAVLVRLNRGDHAEPIDPDGPAGVADEPAAQAVPADTDDTLPAG